MVYTERDLIIPALKIMKDTPYAVDTTELIKQLTKIMKPTGHNGELLSGRQDTYFSQKVRNLESHHTLAEMGVATHEKEIWRITDKGLKYLEEGPKVLESLEWQGIDEKEIDKDIQDYSQIIIEEGAVAWRTSTQRKRSAKLKSKAIESFKKAHDGRIFCAACDFDFGKVYGDWGEGFIEMHHMKPVNIMDIEGTPQTLEKALQNIIPLCSNCHRMVHRKKGKMLTIEELKELINQ